MTLKENLLENKDRSIGKMVFMIIAVAIIIYLILMAWTWQSLGFLEKSKKIAVIVIGIFVVYLLTLIMFQITKSGMNYPSEEMKKSVQNILVAIFTGVNGLVVMPQVGKIIDRINEDQMEKNEWKKRVILLIVSLFICLTFEVGYIKDTQQGILRVYDAMLKNEV